MRKTSGNPAKKGCGSKCYLAVLLVLCFLMLPGFTRKETHQRIFSHTSQSIREGQMEQEQSDQYDVLEYDRDDGEETGTVRYLMYAVLALVVAGIITAAMVSSQKSHVTVDAHTYSKKIRVNPKTREDRFLRTITITKPKEKEKPNGGRGPGDRAGFSGGGRGF